MLPIAFMFMRSATQACIWITNFIIESFWWLEFGKRVPYFTCKARIRCFVKHLKSSFEFKVFLQGSHSRYLGKLKCGYFWSAESKIVSSHLTICSIWISREVRTSFTSALRTRRSWWTGDFIATLKSKKKKTKNWTQCQTLEKNSGSFRKNFPDWNKNLENPF